MNRRLFLKAAGVSIALPSLEAFAVNENSTEPMRMVCMGAALGMNPQGFFPKEYGRDFELSRVLSPLSKLRDDFTVFSHMDHPNVYEKHGAMSALFCGTSQSKVKVAGENYSIDQLAADHVSYTTRYPSLHMCVGGGLKASWTKSGISVPETTSPELIFKKLFVNDSVATSKALGKEINDQGSILDLVRGNAKAVLNKASKNDKEKVDEYLTAIRDAEFKLQGRKQWLGKKKHTTDFKIEGKPHSGDDYNFLSPLFLDLITLAIKTDSSRVFTLGFGMHNRVIELDGVTGGYHGLTHHGNRPEKLKQLWTVEKFYISQYAKLIEKLKAENLLDNTMVFFSSCLGDASRHSNRNMPTLLAGGGFKHGNHWDCMKDNTQAPLNNLYTTMLQKFGVDTEKFANATGTFDLEKGV
ncbi:MAG: DUF1552 domain-containing protein [Lentisphaeraceae bacterium]|nr:DUF1552 domain-containing protein [Lentisphaeraceae bacterium]